MEMKMFNLIALMVFGTVTMITEKPSHAMIAIINALALMT